MTTVLGADEQAALEESVRGLLDRRSSSGAVRAIVDGDRRFDQQVWAEMASLGWTALLVPEAFGGTDAGLSAAVAGRPVSGYRGSRLAMPSAPSR